MLNTIRNIFVGRHLQQSFFVFTLSIVNSLLGFIYYILIARNLSVENFGYFSFLLAIGILAGDLGDWGIDPAIVKFGSASNLPRLFSLGLIQRIIFAVILFTLVIVAQRVYPANLLLSALVAVFLLLLYLVTQSFLAKQQYFFFAATNIFGNLLRIGVVLILIKYSFLQVETALGAFIIANCAAFLAGFLLLQKLTPENLLDFSSLRGTLKEIFPFSLWSGLSFVVAALASKLDNPAVYFLAGSKEAGLYSSVQKLSSVFPQITSSLDSVFAPKLSAQKNNTSLFREYFILAVILAIGLALLMPFSTFLLSLFGTKYLPAAPIFRLLLIGMTLFFLTAPFSSAILYQFGKAKVNFINSILQVIIIAVLYFLLLPKIGAYGAGIAFIIINVFNLIYYTIWYLVLSKHKEEAII